MGQVQLQQNLFTEAGDFVAGMHRNSRQLRIYIAQNRGQWWQESYTFDKAVIYANELQEIDATDCYVSANAYGWKTPGRTVSSVGSINGFFVDFDRYKTPYAHLHPAEFMGIILDENPWLPPPTFFMDSGNGCWAFWLFKRSLTTKSEKYNFLQQWQTQQDFLIGKLSEYGADPACSDAARVVRLTNTINSKTNRKAAAWETGTRYDFGEIKKQFAAEYRKDNPGRQLVPETTTRKKTQSNPGKVSTLFTLHNLAYNRMLDLVTLAKLRGGKYTDHRREAAWIKAVESAHYCRTEESLRAEVEQFILDCIHEPEKYLKAVNYESTVKRFNAEQELVAAGMSRREAHELLDPQNKGRYKLKTRTIVKRLEITPEEQRQLRVLIGKEEKQLRRREKRREQGIQARSDYEGKTGSKAQLKLEAKRLYSKLQNFTKVAEQMGLPRETARRYILT